MAIHSGSLTSSATANYAAIGDPGSGSIAAAPGAYQTGSHTHTVYTGNTVQSNPNLYQWGTSQAPGTSQVPLTQTPPYSITTPSAPTDGMVVVIKDKAYRFSAATDSWHEVIDATDEEIKEAPTVKVNLDGRAMLSALKEYEAFLTDLLDAGIIEPQRQSVYDTLFGLELAIEALERL